MEEEEHSMINRLVRGVALPFVLAAVSSIGLVAQTSHKMANDKTETSSGQLAPADRQFIKKAAQGGLAEVELGKLATEKAAFFFLKQRRPRIFPLFPNATLSL